VYQLRNFSKYATYYQPGCTNERLQRGKFSLVGLLQYATKVVKPGRSFVSRMYSEAAKLKHLSFYVRLSVGFHSDLRWWHLFICHWNGVSFLESFFHPDAQMQTDASGTWGCRCADMLCRNCTAQFLRSHPSASGRPMQVPTPLLTDHISRSTRLDFLGLP